MNPIPKQQVQLAALHSQMKDRFNLDELRELCLHLSINYEELTGDTLSGKLQSLLEHLERHQRINELIVELNQIRPHEEWETFKKDGAHEASPFKGLQHYKEADAHLFFGRESLIQDFIEHLNNQQFLAIIGASGSGKSSLVRAGLIPAIRQRQVKINQISSDKWNVHTISPGHTPLKALAATLTQTSESVSATATLIDDMRQNSQSLDLWLYREFVNRDSHTIIFIDQFEEIFTHCQDQNERECFIANLVHAVQINQSGRLSLIITLRADFYAHALHFAELRHLLETQQKIVGPMNNDEIRTAIEEPLKRNQWMFDSALVETILQDLNIGANQSLEAGNLPLLSHALLETWQRREGRTLTLAGYLAAGGVRQAIANTAEKIYQTFSPDEQLVAKNIFLRLTNVGERTDDTRRRIAKEEILTLQNNESAIEHVLAALIDARLVTVDKNDVEVTHEAIIREWPRLRNWLIEDKENIYLHRQLTEAAEIWKTFNYDPSSLLRGLRLAKFESWVAELNPDLTELESSFLKQSQAELLAEQKRKVSEQQQIRKSSLFGMVGGAASFALSFLLINSSQIEDQSLLAVLMILRVLLGAIGGLMFIILVDMFVSWYQGNHRWISWLLGGLGGAITFSFLLFFDQLLETSAPGDEIVVILTAIEGCIWGFSIGLGRVWLLQSKRPFWQTFPIIGLVTGLVFILSNQLGQAFSTNSLLTLAFIGTFVPLTILASAQLAVTRTN